MSTDEEKHRQLQARIQALRSSSSMDRGARNAIIEQINRERRDRVERDAKRREIDQRLSEVEKEYLEIVEAQEIMDQIDENRKRDV